MTHDVNSATDEVQDHDWFVSVMRAHAYPGAGTDTAADDNGRVDSHCPSPSSTKLQSKGRLTFGEPR